MRWTKFLSRKFLLAVVVLILGIIQTTAPGVMDVFPWKVISVVLAYIFGEAGADIIRAYIEWKKP